RSSRATLGTESGASIVDFDGMVQRRVEDYLVRKPEASYDEVEQAILAPHEANARIATASPRLFEAAALRTALVLFPGGYSVVVGKLAKPWVRWWLVAGDSAVRRLARAHGGPAALEDLWRLAALRRVARRQVVAVTPSLESEGRRLFLSTKLADAGSGRNGAIGPDVRAALQSAVLEEIVWNNSAAGQTVPLIGRRTLPVPIGHHGIDGA